MRDKAFNIAKNPKYDGYQRGFASVVYKLFDRKTSGRDMSDQQLAEEYENMSDQQLAEELHEAIIRKFKKSTITFYRQYMGC